MQPFSGFNGAAGVVHHGHHRLVFLFCGKGWGRGFEKLPFYRGPIGEQLLGIDFVLVALQERDHRIQSGFYGICEVCLVRRFIFTPPFLRNADLDREPVSASLGLLGTQEVHLLGIADQGTIHIKRKAKNLDRRGVFPGPVAQERVELNANALDFNGKIWPSSCAA